MNNTLTFMVNDSRPPSLPSTKIATGSIDAANPPPLAMTQTELLALHSRMTKIEQRLEQIERSGTGLFREGSGMTKYVWRTLEVITITAAIISTWTQCSGVEQDRRHFEQDQQQQRSFHKSEIDNRRQEERRKRQEFLQEKERQWREAQDRELKLLQQDKR